MAHASTVTSTCISLDDLSPLLLSKEIPSTTSSSACLQDDTLNTTLIGPIKVLMSGLHGRGLFATRNIEAGECLFCTPPTVSAPMTNVLRTYQSNPQLGLQHIAETILIKHMKRALKKNTIVAASIMALTANETTIPDIDNDVILQMLIAKASPLTTATATATVKDDDLLQIIRRNAFGPDFYSYNKMQDTISHITFHRILGLYPLAAMLNHSCTPNAVRVFCGEHMLVHATHNVKEGEELLWSYIPPTSGYQDRQHSIHKFGFTCTCTRCTIEKSIPWLATLDTTTFQSLYNQSNQQFISATILEPIIQQLEHLLTTLTNEEQRRYVRVGFMNLYLNYYNASLLHSNNSIDDESIQKIRVLNVLKSATQLHFACCVCCHASTEHLSILHLCYDLVVGWSNTNDNNQKQIKFWTDQLKRAHMVRYGKLGNNLEALRSCMVHTKLVLRNLNGLEKSEYAFL